jgi:hypothetical protein
MLHRQHRLPALHSHAAEGPALHSPGDGGMTRVQNHLHLKRRGDRFVQRRGRGELYAVMGEELGAVTW